jgi:hypothetical protein
VRPWPSDRYKAQHHVAALDVDSDGARRDHWANIRSRQVVTVELNIEYPCFDRALLNAGDQLSEPLSQRYAAAFDADQGQILAAIALFHDLVRQAHQCALDLRGRHQPALDAQGNFAYGFTHGYSLCVAVAASLSQLASRRMIRGFRACEQVVDK